MAISISKSRTCTICTVTLCDCFNREKSAAFANFYFWLPVKINNEYLACLFSLHQGHKQHNLPCKQINLNPELMFVQQ